MFSASMEPFSTFLKRHKNRSAREILQQGLWVQLSDSLGHYRCFARIADRSILLSEDMNPDDSAEAVFELPFNSLLEVRLDSDGSTCVLTTPDDVFRIVPEEPTEGLAGSEIVRYLSETWNKLRPRTSPMQPKGPYVDPYQKLLDHDVAAASRDDHPPTESMQFSIKEHRFQDLVSQISDLRCLISAKEDLINQLATAVARLSSVSDRANKGGCCTEAEKRFHRIPDRPKTACAAYASEPQPEATMRKLGSCDFSETSMEPKEYSGVRCRETLGLLPDGKPAGSRVVGLGNLSLPLSREDLLDNPEHLAVYDNIHGADGSESDSSESA
jgi:hypothetical protein